MLNLTLVCASALEQFDVLGFFSLPFLGSITNVWGFLVLIGLVFYSMGLTTGAGYFNTWVVFFSWLLQFLNQLFLENLLISKNIYFWGLGALFLFILSSNILGLIPFGLTLTSFLFITFFFSVISFFSSVFIAVYSHGFGFFAAFIPSGTPMALKSSLVVIEFISYVARLFSLAIRLFANMMSGHSLLKILTSFFLGFISSLAVYGLPALVLFVILGAITALESVIAFLQAYVFLILTCIYTNEAILGAH